MQAAICWRTKNMSIIKSSRSKPTPILRISFRYFTILFLSFTILSILTILAILMIL